MSYVLEDWKRKVNISAQRRSLFPFFFIFKAFDAKAFTFLKYVIIIVEPGNFFNEELFICVALTILLCQIHGKLLLSLIILTILKLSTHLHLVKDMLVIELRWILDLWNLLELILP